jgi:hypothetical protein
MLEVIVRLKPFRLAIVFLLLTIFPSLRTFAQDSTQNPIPPPQFPGQAPTPQDEDRARFEKEQAKKANEERQAQLKRDTDKLLTLATELKQSVDKSNENTLSMDVIKKADEIEKLARSVKEKMKGN